MSFKKSLLMLWKIWRLFVNTLNADDKYCIFKRENLKRPIPIRLSQKQKNFSQFFSTFLKFSLNFEHFGKKDDPMYFQNYVLRKRWFDKCVKTPVSEDPSKSSIVNGPKHCCILDGSTSTIFTDHCEGNRVGKSLF